MSTAPNAASSTNTYAVISLVCGILGWSLLPFLGSIGAVIFGHVARRQIRASHGTQEGNGLALAGLILGWISIGLFIAGVTLFILFFGGLAMFASLNA